MKQQLEKAIEALARNIANESPSQSISDRVAAVAELTKGLAALVSAYAELQRLDRAD